MPDDRRRSELAARYRLGHGSRRSPSTGLATVVPATPASPVGTVRTPRHRKGNTRREVRRTRRACGGEIRGTRHVAPPPSPGHDARTRVGTRAAHWRGLHPAAPQVPRATLHVPDTPSSRRRATAPWTVARSSVPRKLLPPRPVSSALGPYIPLETRRDNPLSHDTPRRSATGVVRRERPPLGSKE